MAMRGSGELASCCAGLGGYGIFPGSLAGKLQHWRGTQGKNGWSGAPVPDFEVLAARCCRIHNRHLPCNDVIM